MSFPTLGTWIEIGKQQIVVPNVKSFPTLGTWIEIPAGFGKIRSNLVVPYIGNVD